MPTDVVIRGVTPSGDAAETFKVANGSASWTSPVDEGSAALFRARLFPPAGWTVPEQLRPKSIGCWPPGCWVDAAPIGPCGLRQSDVVGCHRAAGNEARRPHLRQRNIPIAAADLGRERQVLRRTRRTRPASRGLRRQSGQDAGGAGCGDRRNGASNGEEVPDSRCEAARPVQQCEAVRRGSAAVRPAPICPDERRQDRRGRRCNAGRAAGGDAYHRRRRQDARARACGTATCTSATTSRPSANLRWA